MRTSATALRIARCHTPMRSCAPPRSPMRTTSSPRLSTATRLTSASVVRGGGSNDGHDALLTPHPHVHTYDLSTHVHTYTHTQILHTYTHAESARRSKQGRGAAATRVDSTHARTPTPTREASSGERSQGGRTALAALVRGCARARAMRMLIPCNRGGPMCSDR